MFDQVSRAVREQTRCHTYHRGGKKMPPYSTEAPGAVKEEGPGPILPELTLKRPYFAFFCFKIICIILEAEAAAAGLNHLKQLVVAVSTFGAEAKIKLCKMYKQEYFSWNQK